MKWTNHSGCLNISGNITCQTLDSALLADFLGELNRTQTLSFAKVNEADSACIALLVAAKRHLGERALTVCDTPAGIRHLLQLYELEQWITPT